MTRLNLHAVEPAPDAPPPDMSYEYLDRQRILNRNWAETHIVADKRPPLPFWSRVVRTWRR